MGTNTRDAAGLTGLLLARRRRRLSNDLLVKARPGDAAPAVFGDLFFESAAGAQALTQSSRADNAGAFYAATVARGAVTLAPARHDNAATFHAPAVGRGPVTLAPALLSATATFYAPTVAQSGGGAQALLPGRYDAAQAFYAATVTRGPVTLAPGRVDSAPVFYAPTVTRGAVVLAQAVRLDNAAAFYAANVSAPAGTQALVQGTRHTNAAQFYAHAVAATYSVAPPRIDAAPTFWAPAVTVGAVALQPALLVNVGQFFGPVLYREGDQVDTAAGGAPGWRLGAARKLRRHRQDDELMLLEAA